jgi:hypothetical protein
MLWARLLAYVAGSVNQEPLWQNEYLVAENRILKAQIEGRLLLSKEEKATLAEIAPRLGDQRENDCKHSVRKVSFLPFKFNWVNANGDFGRDTCEPCQTASNEKPEPRPSSI